MAAALPSTALPSPASTPSAVFPANVLSGVANNVVSETIATGDTNWVQKSNSFGAMVDNALLALGPGILTGLTLTNSGLTLTVAAGKAIIGGLVEVTANTNYTLPASQPTVFIWLKQDGTIAHTTSTTAPGYAAVLLGSCETNGSGVVGSFDESGVIKIVDGLSWRQTGDAGAPSDSPGSGRRIFTKNSGGAIYLWDGAAHVKISP